MAGATISQLWATSALLFPGGGVRRFRRRIRFTGRAWRERASIAPLLTASPGGLLKRTIEKRPLILGFIAAPYLCSDWDAAQRVCAFARHVETLEDFPGLFDFALDERVELMPLPHLGPDYHLVLDKPIWFHREGTLVLNLFRDNLRLMSLAFALDRQTDQLVSLIGAIQGRDIEGIKDEFRQMTKDSFGIRPRDLLIELFRMLARRIGVGAIFGVSDACRHHRSPFFDKNTNRALPLDYDEIWQDRGGTREGSFFRISPARQDRPEEEIPARKRSMYRQRYALLDKLEDDMKAAMDHPIPVRKGDAD